MIKACIFTDEVSRDFEEAVRLSKEKGADYVEIRGGIWGKDVTTIDDNDIQKMRDVMSKYNVRIGSIGSPFGKCRFDDNEYQRHMSIFRKMVQLAHIFDTKIIRMFAFWVPEEFSGKARPNISDYLTEIASRLKPAAKIAESEGVIMALETEDSTLVGSCAEARAVVDAVESDAMKVCWDVNNSWHCGEIPYPDGYEFIRGLIRHIHVKPNAQKSIDTVGDSNVSYKQIFHALLKDGYDGCASIEHWGSPEMMLKGLVELNAVLAKL